MSHISDIVRDKKLDTSFVDNFTVHHYDDSDEERYERSVQRSEYWEHDGLIGKGGYGDVFRQKCVQGKGRYELRAVKVISTGDAKTRHIRNASELEAIAKFSQRRVSCYPMRSFQRRLANSCRTPCSIPSTS
jgi:hypothetical protein